MELTRRHFLTMAGALGFAASMPAAGALDAARIMRGVRQADGPPSPAGHDPIQPMKGPIDLMDLHKENFEPLVKTAFSVKMAFTDGGGTEHIWLAPVTYDGTSFRGTVNNEPQIVRSVKMGQKVTVAPAQISDWMYVENRKLVGGQTLRVMRDALSPAERADFDKGLPFRVE